MVIRNMPKVRKAPDEYVQRAIELQAGLEVASSDERAQCIAELGEAADAYDFWEAANVAANTAIPSAPDGARTWGTLVGDAMVRVELEALVLANKSPTKIARHVGISEQAVIWYERWWFDVRDRLTNAGWISTQVIGSLHQGTIATLLPATIKAYGYYTRSARIVKAAAGMFDINAARRAGRDPGRFFATDAANAGAIKAALVARMLPIHDPRTYARVIELHHEARDVDAKTKQLGGSEDEALFRDATSRLFGRVERGYGAAPTDAPEVRQLPRLVTTEPPLEADAG